MGLFKKILVALDDSSESNIVFDGALELAQTHGASLKLLNCLTNEIVGEPVGTLPLEMGLYPELVTTYPTYPALLEQRLEQAQQMLQSHSESAKSRGVRVEYDCQVGEAGACLCQEAKKWGADLIVLGRRGRTGLTEALLGSVSNYVLHHAPCSVLVIQSLETESAIA